jgi:y4mF family transcriptional regulator
MTIAQFIKHKRKEEKISQPELAFRARVGLRFIRDLEQGKKTLRMDKVNAVLGYFGYELGAIKIEVVDYK